jgi:uncharacterized protein (TIGR00369 family)
MLPEGARADALDSIDAVRNRGAGFYEHFLGVRRASVKAGRTLVDLLARPQALENDGSPAPGALATVADVAMYSALRLTLDPRFRMPTFSLTLQILRQVPTGRVYAHGEVLELSDQIGVARCRLAGESGEVLAEATCSNALVLRQEDGTRPPLWYGAPESQTPVPADPDTLSDAEHRTVEHVERSLELRGPDGPFADFLGLEWQTRGTGASAAYWPLGPHLRNHVGQIHGGALFGTLALAATVCAPTQARPRLVEQHVQLLRAPAGDELRVHARVLRQGRQLISVEGEVLDVGGRVIARSLATLLAAREPSEEA